MLRAIGQWPSVSLFVLWGVLVIEVCDVEYCAPSTGLDLIFFEQTCGNIQSAKYQALADFPTDGDVEEPNVVGGALSPGQGHRVVWLCAL